MLTVGQVANRLNVSCGTIYSACDVGEIEHYRIGRGRGTIRITEEAVAAYLILCARKVDTFADNTSLKHLKL